ncbi:MAG: hypothetical protein QME21_08530 [Anaerolineales bacterium]|nr:hypothetical protein [Anaerolineales bacterium]
MTLPSLLLGLLLSTLYAAGFHFFRGGGAGRLLLDLFLAYSGFWAGHYLGETLGLTLARMGSLQVGLASLVAFIFLFVGNWLSQEPAKNKK